MKEKTDLKYERVVCRFDKTLHHEARNKQTELGSIISDTFRKAYGLNLMLLASGSIRDPEAGPIVTYKDLCEFFPYNDPCYQIVATGKQLKHMLEYTYRDDALDGKHTEFYQLSNNFEVVYDRSRHEIIVFRYNDRDIQDDQLFTIGLQGWHFTNIEDIFNIPLSEIEKNQTPRKISTGNLDVLDEALSSGKPEFDQNWQKRLKII